MFTIFISMVKKKKVDIISNETYILPTPNNEMTVFVNKFKIDMMEHVVSSIKFAIENKLPIVEIFQFNNSPFVITISKKEFISNLEHIHNFYVNNEIYELCPKVERLLKILKDKSDEKEKPKE